jgi:hypothetical protein
MNLWARVGRWERRERWAADSAYQGTGLLWGVLQPGPYPRPTGGRGGGSLVYESDSNPETERRAEMGAGPWGGVEGKVRVCNRARRGEALGRTILIFPRHP